MIRLAVKNLIKTRGKIAGHKIVDFIYTTQAEAGYSRDDVEEATENVLTDLLAAQSLHFIIRNAKLLRLTARPKRAGLPTFKNEQTQRLEKAIVAFSQYKPIECENLTSLLDFLRIEGTVYKFDYAADLVCHCLCHLVTTKVLALRIRKGQFMQLV